MLTFAKNLFTFSSLFAVTMTTITHGLLALDIHCTLSSHKPAQSPAVVAIDIPKVTPKVQPAKPRYIEVVDVAASIRSWNEEAWCRPHWNKGRKCSFRDRQIERPAKSKAIAEAFQKVWGSSSIQVQKLALAVCIKETGCGFSEQRSYRKRNGKITNENGTRIWRATKFMSEREACGLTQVDTRDNVGKVKCAVLNASYENAFRWQKTWLEKWWNDGHKTKPTKVDLYGLKWLKPYQIDENNSSYLIWRYNGGGKGAWRYGRITMDIYHNHIVVQKVKVTK